MSHIGRPHTPVSRVLDDGWRACPQVVEIEVNRRCNLRCPYCPQSFDWFRKPEQRMPAALYGSILTGLARMGFMGRLSFHHYNEPLLRKDLGGLVAQARTALPGAFLVLYTNGMLLTDARYRTLLDAGVDQFFVTLHAGGDIPPRPFQIVRRPGSFRMSARGGLVDTVPEPWGLPCYAPSEMLTIRHNGEVVLCHEDATGREVMGDLTVQAVEDIWNNDRFRAARLRLERGERATGPALCRQCDNRLHPVPDTAI